MKKIKIFIQAQCPYCQRALNDIAILKEDPKYSVITFEIIDELVEVELADSYDYYYVPSFYYQDRKIHEGAIEMSQTQALLDRVLADNE